MKKYFTFDNEKISGGTYWLRSFLQSILIYFFGLGIYLMAVTIYKRSRSLGSTPQDAGIMVAVMIGGSILGLVLAYTPGVETLGLMIIFFTNIVCHWYLWFTNAPKTAS